MSFVKQAQFAEMCGVSRKTVTMWREAGKLVMQGKLVDVDATSARMKRFHHSGSPVKNQVTNFVTSEGNKVTTRPKVTKFVTSEGELTTISLTNLEIRERLSEVDWAHSFDWSEEGQEARARHACEMLGWEMVIADHVDDGHWGGFQIRINEFMGNGLHEGAVAGGFGFELYPVDVLRLARDHITGWDREDTFDGSQTEPIEIPEALIGVLAYPLFEYQRRPQ